MDTTEIAEQVIYRVLNAPLLNYPFQHFYVEDVFPQDYFHQLRARLPALENYVSLAETGTVGKDAYPERFVLNLRDVLEAKPGAPQDPFLRDLAEWMLGMRFLNAMLKRFGPQVKARVGEVRHLDVANDARLIRDHTNYSLSPHTDAREKMVSLLFYLPADDSAGHLGTSVYVPRDPGFRCPGGPHHPRENFIRVSTARYAPNCLLGFWRTDASFHGVEKVTEIGVTRDLLLYNIYLPSASSPHPEA